MLEVIGVVASVIALVPVFYFVKERLVERKYDLDLDFENAALVPFRQKGNEKDGNVALVLYVIRIVNNSNQNTTIKKVLLTCHSDSYDYTTESHVIQTGTLSNGDEAALLTNGVNRIYLMEWENLRSKIGNHDVLPPNGVLAASAVFLLDVEPRNVEEIESFSITVQDYNGYTSKHHFSVQSGWKGFLRKGFFLVSRAFIQDKDGGLTWKDHE